MTAEREGEASVVAEAVEESAARVLAGSGPVLTLVEEQTGLLPQTKIDVVFDAELGDGDGIGNVSREHVDPLLQSLEHPRSRVVARKNASNLLAVRAPGGAVEGDALAARGLRRRCRQDQRQGRDCRDSQAAIKGKGACSIGRWRQSSLMRSSSTPSTTTPPITVRGTDVSPNSSRMTA